MHNKKIKHFKVLPVKFSDTSTSHHELFFKEHSTKKTSEDKPSDRTLFVLNIPPYATGESMKNVFSKAGEVENVIFNNTHTPRNPLLNNENEFGFKNGYVIFKKPIGVLQAMKLTELEPLSTSDEPILCGMKKWAKEYNGSIYDVKELQKNVNKFMKEYDKETELNKKKDLENKETDEEGWTMVTKKSRNPGFARKKSLVDKIQEKIEQGKKKKELKNFYTFQIRESKMKHLAGLRKKFEEDKKKIESLKQARRFKPY